MATAILGGWGRHLPPTRARRRRVAHAQGRVGGGGGMGRAALALWAMAAAAAVWRPEPAAAGGPAGERRLGALRVARGLRVLRGMGNGTRFRGRRGGLVARAGARASCEGTGGSLAASSCSSARPGRSLGTPGRPPGWKRPTRCPFPGPPQVGGPSPCPWRLFFPPPLALGVLSLSRVGWSSTGVCCGTLVHCYCQPDQKCSSATAGCFGTLMD